MPITKENAIFFAGGKKVEPIKTDKLKGLKFEKINNPGNPDDGSWNITLELSIPKAEAEKVIRKYADFKITDPTKFEDLAPNQIFFEAFGAAGNSVFIAPNEVKLNVLYDKGTKGEIVISFVPVETGKTQNTKTQNFIDTPPEHIDE